MILVLEKSDREAEINSSACVNLVYIVTLLIFFICKVHHEKRWAGRSPSWNQDCREKYQ